MIQSGRLQAAMKLYMSCCSKLRHTAQTRVIPAARRHTVRSARPLDSTSPQRELFLNILNANATKRDAKQYLARFRKDGATANSDVGNLQRRAPGNLPSIYGPTRAIAESPQFIRNALDSSAQSSIASEGLSVALVCLRDANSIHDDVLNGLALTLSQLIQLDMRIILVVEETLPYLQPQSQQQYSSSISQLERAAKLIASHHSQGARIVTGALEITDRVRLTLPELILEPLRRGVVPIIPLRTYTTSGFLVETGVSEIMAALASQFSPSSSSSPISPDRIILLDAPGGIPSRARDDGSHVFVNLMQEFHDIDKELADCAAMGRHQRRDYLRHQENLRLINRCLNILPATSSALLVSPQEAASSATGNRALGIGTGTRRQKNTLIHNLLTNRPSVSSSLPSARIAQASVLASQAPTLFKRGMTLSIVPPAHPTLGWQVRQENEGNVVQLEKDARIDFPRLLNLMENSFGRKVDVEHYLTRINGRIAGLIVAGEYEGGAILTWEQPAGTSDPNRLVPYLDKFAVLQSSQGSSGVADILFQAMTRTCFPQGVVWRSRKENPVNKWYFERAAGSWQLPGDKWTMFWTGEMALQDNSRLADYISVCKGVVPSFL